MGIRQRKRETIERLAEKTLEARFVTEVTQGLNCSPFEARAVLGVVQEVFAPLWREASRLPGRSMPRSRRGRRSRIARSECSSCRRIAARKTIASCSAVVRGPFVGRGCRTCVRWR